MVTPHLFIKPCHLPVNGHGRSQGSLWRILKCYGGAEEGHYPVPCHLVHRAFIGVHPVNEDLIYLIHHGIHALGTELFGEGGETFHVAEHYRNLSLLTFNLVPLGEYLLSDALWEILLDLLQFLIKGEFLAGWLGRKGEVVATLPTKRELWWIGGIAAWANELYLHPTLPTEVHAFRILKVTL